MAFFKTLIESSTPIRFVSKEKYNNTNKNHILVHDSKMFDQFALKGEVGLCEAYMNGDWDAIDIEYYDVETVSETERLA